MRSLSIRLSLLALVAVLAAACSSGGSTSAPTISDAWVRPPMGADSPAAGYLTMKNSSDQADALLSVSSPVASSVEIHETTTDASGMMGMQPVDKIEVPAGGTVALEPGGYHLMLMGVTQMLEVGSKVELDLVFERAGKVVVQADVKQG
jgi:copper(I)-binding protein